MVKMAFLVLRANNRVDHKKELEKRSHYLDADIHLTNHYDI